MDGTFESTAPDPDSDQQREGFEGLLVAGSYRVAFRLGSGGMGDVYHAEHVRLGSPVAIKFLRSTARLGARSSDRFRTEARRAAGIRSAHVVRVFDYGRLDDGTPYLVMERLFGEDLRSLLAREGALAIRRAVQLVLGACRGLSAVHAAGLVHRDLKPANLFVEQGLDQTEVCKVLDFGVAKALESDTTRPGALVGTVRYMAPEQLENAATATRTADVYALGTILYECVTGVVAHQGETLEQTMFHIVHGGVSKPSLHRPVPMELEAAMLRALSREPSQRFGSMDELARALAPFGPVDRAPEPQPDAAADTVDEAGPRSRERPRGAERSHALWIAAIACAFGAGAGWAVRGSAQRPAMAARATARDAPAPRRQDVLPAGARTPASASTRPAEPPPLPSAVPPTRSERTVDRSARRPTASVITPVREQPRAAYPRNTEPIAGGFDPKDPYE